MDFGPLHPFNPSLSFIQSHFIPSNPYITSISPHLLHLHLCAHILENGRPWRTGFLLLNTITSTHPFPLPLRRPSHHHASRPRRHPSFDKGTTEFLKIMEVQEEYMEVQEAMSSRE